MLCGCGKASDTASLYQYSSEHSQLITQHAAPSKRSKAPQKTHQLSSKEGTSPGGEGRLDEVLLSDQSYPCGATCGAWNPAFDSGIESGTLTLDSCNQSIDGGNCSHTTDILERMRRSASVPLLEFSEKYREEDNPLCSSPNKYTSCKSLTKSSKMYQTYQGQLKVAVYMNYGLLTVHVMEGRHFISKSGQECNSYVKVSLMPDGLRRTKCRTDVINTSNEPRFDEKFSFELLDEDVNKRVLISVWNRIASHQRSELLGCMSFGIQHILEEKTMANGWYFLLSEHVGKRKHLHVHDKRRPLVGGLNTSSCASVLTSPSDKTSECSSTFCGSVYGIHMNRSSPTISYGITLTGGSPAGVFTIEPGSPADVAGMTTSHRVLKVQGQDVSRATADTVARIIRFCDTKLHLEVHQCTAYKCMFEDPPPSLPAPEASTPLDMLPRQPHMEWLTKRELSQSWLSQTSVALSDRHYSDDESTVT